MICNANDYNNYKSLFLSVRQDMDPHDKMPGNKKSHPYYASSIGPLISGLNVSYPNSAGKRFLEEKKRDYIEHSKV